jgi:ribosomal protein S18 acetylase RimI-like enzyme
MEVTVRPARPDDRSGPGLLYESAQPYYDAFTGSPARAERMLARLWDRPGHTAGFDACRVVELDGVVAGASAAFAADEGDALARRFLAGALLRLAVWQWPHVVRHLRASAEVMPVPPPGSLYVDALAVAEPYRGRGAATALLDDACARAVRDGLQGVSLDTGVENRVAQALYTKYGFTVTGERHAPDERVAAAIGGSGFVSYFKPL